MNDMAVVAKDIIVSVGDGAVVFMEGVLLRCDNGVVHGQSSLPVSFCVFASKMTPDPRGSTARRSAVALRQ